VCGHGLRPFFPPRKKLVMNMNIGFFFCNFSSVPFFSYISYIQGVSGGIVNILGGGSMDYSE
jgi:hypothetical protein